MEKCGIKWEKTFKLNENDAEEGRGWVDEVILGIDAAHSRVTDRVTGGLLGAALSAL